MSPYMQLAGACLCAVPSVLRPRRVPRLGAVLVWARPAGAFMSMVLAGGRQYARVLDCNHTALHLQDNALRPGCLLVCVNVRV